MMRCASLIISTILFAAPQEPAAAVEGTVVEAGSGRPMSKVAVELRSVAVPAVAIAATRTEVDGKFHFRNVAPGPYRLVATRPDQITAEFGQLTLNPGQRVADIRIAMSPGAVISGRITDRGQPVAWADAVAIRAIRTEGRLSFTPVLSTRTNDLGEYSLFWLPPGRYYILGIVWDTPGSVGYTITPDGTDRGSFTMQRYIGKAVFMRAVGSGNADTEAHVPMYYPGTPDPELAKVIEVSPGGEMRGIDIDVSPLPVVRVRGRVTGIPDGSRATVDMRPVVWTLYTTPAQRGPNVATDTAGNFEMMVVSGRYVLTAFGGGMETYTSVDARGGDVTNAVVLLSRGRGWKGEFRNVPPGEYKLFGWEKVELGSWQDSAFMRDFESRGVSVRIEEGKQTSIDVKVILR